MWGMDGIRRLFRIGSVRPDPREELDEELAFHFGRTVEELEARGMSRAEARAEADRRFGDRARYRREIERIDRSRTGARKRTEWLDLCRQVLSFTLRGLRRHPGFAAAVVLTLALGIGANAVMFRVVDRILLSPPEHLRDAETLRKVYVRRTFLGRQATGTVLAYPDYIDVGEAPGVIAAGAYMGADETVVGEGPNAHQARAAFASASLFSTLGVEPHRGRFFAEEEDRVGGSPAAVLSHAYWTRRFDADPAVLDGSTSIRMDGHSIPVVGVAPPGFTGAELGRVDVWLPLGSTAPDDWFGTRNVTWLTAVVRLADDASDEAVQEAATASYRAARADTPSPDPNARVLLAPVIDARGPRPSAESRVSRWVAGVSLLVLLIACANVANLFLARAVRWRRELAVRVALGVSRARLLGTLAAESLVLAGLAALLSLALAAWGGALVQRALFPEVAFTAPLLNGRFLAYVTLAAVLSATLSGALPALRAAREDVAPVLKQGGRGDTGRAGRVRAWLLGVQGCLSVVLLVGAGLFVASVRQASTVDLGYDAARIATVEIDFEAGVSAEARTEAYRRIEGDASRTPGVSAAVVAYTLPFSSSYGPSLSVPGLDSVPSGPDGGPYINKVGAGYLEAMGIPLLRGRPFEPRDDAPGAPPVAVVTEAMAAALWPREDALGGCLRVQNPADGECTTVVGVVADHRRQSLTAAEAEFQYFVNLAHPFFTGPPRLLIARTDGPAEDRVDDLRAAVASTGSGIRFARVSTLTERIAPELRSWRLGATMFSLFGALALLVAAVGLYSVLTFDVAERRHELGVRAALGARLPRLVREGLARGLGQVAGGMVVGVGVGLTTAPYIEPLLFRVSAREPAVYGTVVLLLLLVSLAATAVPARRIARLDPADSLREG